MDGGGNNQEVAPSTNGKSFKNEDVEDKNTPEVLKGGHEQEVARGEIEDWGSLPYFPGRSQFST